MSRTSNPQSEYPEPISTPDTQLDIVPPDLGKEVDAERQIVDGLLENPELPWVRKSWNERGQA